MHMALGIVANVLLARVLFPDLKIFMGLAMILYRKKICKIDRYEIPNSYQSVLRLPPANIQNLSWGYSLISSNSCCRI